MGVFIFKGMSVRIPPGGLRINIADDGALSGSATLEVALDLWPMWLDTALDHALQSYDESMKLQQLMADDDRSSSDEALRAEVMVAECKAGMVSVAAAAFALENFANVAARFAPGIERVKTDWENAKTPQNRRIAETLRRTFKMSNARAKECRKLIARIFKFRNWAVHPSGDYAEPRPHYLLGAAVDWRVEAFKATNAANATYTAALIVAACVDSPRSTNPRLVDWCIAAREWSEPLAERAKKELPVQFKDRES